MDRVGDTLGATIQERAKGTLVAQFHAALETLDEVGHEVDGKPTPDMRCVTQIA